MHLKEDIGSNTIVVRDFNNALSPLDRPIRLKLIKEIMALNKDQMEGSSRYIGASRYIHGYIDIYIEMENQINRLETTKKTVE